MATENSKKKKKKTENLDTALKLTFKVHRTPAQLTPLSSFKATHATCSVPSYEQTERVSFSLFSLVYQGSGRW
jgi:hypothetical protein